MNKIFLSTSIALATLLACTNGYTQTSKFSQIAPKLTEALECHDFFRKAKVESNDVSPLVNLNIGDLNLEKIPGVKTTKSNQNSKYRFKFQESINVYGFNVTEVTAEVFTEANVFLRQTVDMETNDIKTVVDKVQKSLKIKLKKNPNDNVYTGAFKGHEDDSNIFVIDMSKGDYKRIELQCEMRLTTGGD